MKTDITNRTDIEKLIDSFYEKVKTDDKIGHFFSEVVHVNWEKHLPVMYGFWENILFHSGGYEGNPMQKHIALHVLSPLKPEHFQRWLLLFFCTVDDLFEGNNAEQIKQRAQSIALVMEMKVGS